MQLVVEAPANRFGVDVQFVLSSADGVASISEIRFRPE
jgi:hypothetical protein